MDSRRNTAILLLIVAACLAGSAAVMRRIDRIRSGAVVQEVLYLGSARAIKHMSLGYDGLLANIYWTRVVQYFGGKHHEGAMTYKLLAPLLDITTELDPQLLIAYQFGSIFLSQQPPQGAGDPMAAVQLVERGIQRNPKEWRLYYNLGWVYYSELHDPAAAARAFEQGSRVPGAHPSLKILAALMAERADDIGTARYLWHVIYQSTEDKMVRASAIQHLRCLQVDEDITRLDSAVQAYQLREGRLPTSWIELTRAGLIRGIPRDPLGRVYRVMPDGSIQVESLDDLPFITKGLPPGARSKDFLGARKRQ